MNFIRWLGIQKILVSLEKAGLQSPCGCLNEVKNKTNEADDGSASEAPHSSLNYKPWNEISLCFQPPHKTPAKPSSLKKKPKKLNIL